MRHWMTRFQREGVNLPIQLKGTFPFLTHKKYINDYGSQIGTVGTR